MKVVFAGPSLYGASYVAKGVELRPPAAQGDLLAAVLEGARVIGLIDGAFEATASVWHKEILYALQQGVTVAGGASMGALRAAECAPFGMIPVGSIATCYFSGEYDDDALVAITHGPAELGSPPLTEALVDSEATIAAMQAAGALDAAGAARALAAARALFYKDRTVEELARASAADAAGFAADYRRHHVSVKTADALAVLTLVRALPTNPPRSPADFVMSEPPLWREALAAAGGERASNN